MFRWRGPGRSLATSLLLSTFALISAAVVLLAATSVTGVYRTVGDLHQQQMSSECMALAGSLRARFGGAADVLDGIVSGTSSASQGLNSRQWIAGFEHFDKLLLVDPTGKVASAYPRSAAAEIPPAEVLSTAASVTSFTHTGTDATTGEPVVWAARRITATGRDLIAGRLRMGFVTDLIARSALADRLVCVSADEGPIYISGGTRGQANGIIYAADRSVGVGRATCEGRSPLDGRFLDVVGVPGMTWRVAVLQRRGLMIEYARTALTPAAIAGLLVSSLIAIGAVVAARLLVAPLRELERRAQRAASGAYVRPIEMERRDEVGRLAAAFNHLTKRLNALHDISRLLGSASRTEQVLDSILAAVAHITPVAQAAVFLIDMVSGDLVAERASEGSPIRPGDRLPMGTERALRQALLADGPVALPRAEACEGRGRGECLGVPLGLGGEAFGLLLLWDAQRPFTDAEIETLGTFVAQAAVALGNSRLFEAEYASRLDAEALREVAEHLADPRDLASAMTSVKEVAGRLLGADRTVLGLWEREAFGLPPALDLERESALLQVMASAGGGASGGTLVVEDVSSRPIADPYSGLGVRSLIVVPLTVGDEPAGCLGFEYTAGAVWFGEARLGLANTIGKQLSLALSNAYLFAQAQRRATNLETIFRISQAVGSSLETRVVLDRVLDVVQKIFSADAVSLMTYDPTKRLLVTPMARGIVSREILELEVRPGEDVPGDVFAQRHPRMLGRLDPHSDGVEAYAASRGLRSLAAVPLLARGRSIGVLSMYSRESHAYREEDIELLSTFAAQAALAIDTANLYGREHAVASVLQSSIVPDKLPAIPGIDADSVYRPASTDAEIGGDYYDVFVVRGDCVVLAMCDVCGKGVDAATKTSRVKYTVRALAAAGSTPAHILTEVNRIVGESGDSTDIVTVIVAVLDRTAGTLTYANGGHPPAFLRAPGSPPRRLAPTGPLLGAVPDASFGEVTVEAPEGSAIVMYTDGVTEARRGNRFFGEKRVRRALAAGGSASEITRRVLSSLRRFTPGDLRDDVAILAVRIESEDEQPGAGS